MPLISGYCLGDFLEFFFGIPFCKISENMRFWCPFQIFHNLSNLPWKESSLVTCFSSSCFATPKAKDNEPALTSSFLWTCFSARKGLILISSSWSFRSVFTVLFRAVPRIFCLRGQTPQTFTGISRIQTGFLVGRFVFTPISFPGGGNCPPCPPPLCTALIFFRLDTLKGTGKAPAMDFFLFHIGALNPPPPIQA